MDSVRGRRVLLPAPTTETDPFLCDEINSLPTSRHSSIRIIPLLQEPTPPLFDDNDSHGLREARYNSLSTSSERASSRGRNPSDADWNHHRDIITRLYWDENLSMPVVREYMKREHGFDATPRAYKFRFRKWGLRKNIKEHEALEIVSGQRDPTEFWAGTKRVNFERRIARHLEKDAQDGERPPRFGSPAATTTTTRRASQAAISMPGTPVPALGGRRASMPMPVPVLAPMAVFVPRHLKAPGVFNHLEAGIYWANVWLESNKHREDWFSYKLELGEDEDFFPLFTRGMDALGRGKKKPQEAFIDINKSFDHVKGLISVCHPLVFTRLICRVASFKYYPNSDICFDVCRMLLKHAWELFRAIHGNNHVLNNIWASHFDVFKNRDVVGYFEHWVDIAMILFASHWDNTRGPIDLTSLRIDQYVPSEARFQDEETMRSTLDDISRDPSPENLSVAQDTRLALAELLITQDRIDEGRQFIDEAVALRDMDLVNPAGRHVWMAELEWRTEHKDSSVHLLREALRMIDSSTQERLLVEAAGDPNDKPASSISTVQILSILVYRLAVMGRGHDTTEYKRRLVPLLTRTQQEQGTPFQIHLRYCDLEMEPDPVPLALK